MPRDPIPSADPPSRPTRVAATRRRSRRRLAWWLLSAALHGAVLLALLLHTGRPNPPDGGEPPAYDLVFAEPTPDATPPPDPGTDTPAPPVPPDPNAAPAARPPEAPPAPPTPEPSPEPPSEPPPAPPEPKTPPGPPVPQAPIPETPATPAPAKPAAAPTLPAVRIAEPDLPPPLSPPPPVPIPQAPPPLPQAPPPQAPAPRPRAQQTQRFPAPIDLNFGPASPTRPAPGSVASRAIDLTLPKAQPGSARALSAELRSPNASADLMAALESWWRRHRYYPEQARRAGEDGSVGIRLQVDRYGKVESVEMNSRSGSQWLDLAALGTFRGAQLTVPSNAGKTVSVDLTINYVLIR